MRLFAESSTNDFVIGSDQQLLVLDGLEAVAQKTRSAVEAQKGEMIFAVERGIDYDKALWSGTPDLQQWQFYFNREVLAIEEVDSITSLDATVENNTLNYTALIQSTEGEVEVSGII